MVEADLAKRIVTAARKGGEWARRRDELIVEALEAGGSAREVAKLAGLTHPAVSAIHQRWRAAQPAD